MSFISNGLLGSVSLAESEKSLEPEAEFSLNSTTTLQIKSNAPSTLLWDIEKGDDGSRTNFDAAFNADSGEPFRATGLLSESSFGMISSISKTSLELENDLEGEFIVDGNTLSQGFGEKFAANGLLSSVTSTSVSSSITNEFVPNGLLPTEHTQEREVSPRIDNLIAPTVPRTTNETLSSRPVGSLYRVPIRATTYDGKTFHLKRRLRVDRQERSSNKITQSIGSLLDVPIHRLLEQISMELAAKLSDPTLETAGPSDPSIEDALWVDRYRPRHFTDLLGNERVARETMAWVKQWDWCVFGKKKDNRKGKKRVREDEPAYVKEDEYHRPKEKLLLLSGPPGLGKTTLAHVVARQAGYEIMEINASDARTAQIIDDRIRPALESGSAVGSTKPIMIVIDEIDGATGGSENSSGFVHKLVQLTYEKPRKKGRNTHSSGPSTHRPLLRPIICICNDAYAASLTKLRPHTLHLRMGRPSDIHVVQRLRAVCSAEGMRVEGRALSTLVGVAKGDLRGCLNILQFIKARANRVTEPLIRAATVGMKEGDTSINSILNGLFTPLTKKRAKELGISEEEEARYVGRLSHEVEGSDQLPKIALGCFGHYTHLRRHDANFTRYEKANEWLVTYDVLTTATYNGEFALTAYLPYTLVAFHPLFHERGGPRVERSQEDWDYHLTTQTNEEIYKTLSRALRAASGQRTGDYRHLASELIMQLEFAPILNRIISPPLRPVNSQIIRPNEKAILSRLVGIMAALELRFVQEKAEDGQLVYRLDPPIDVFVTYDGKRAVDIAVSRYAVRHMVATEIDAQLIQRQTDAVGKGTDRKLRHLSKTLKRKERDEKDPQDDPLEDSKDSSQQKRARSDISNIADKPPTDFFGRPITSSSTSKDTMGHAKNAYKGFCVSYRFAEGNSAAVRKPVKIGAFL